MKDVDWVTWGKAALIRGVRTFAEAMLAAGRNLHFPAFCYRITISDENRTAGTLNE